MHHPKSNVTRDDVNLRKANTIHNLKKVTDIQVQFSKKGGHCLSISAYLEEKMILVLPLVLELATPYLKLVNITG